MNVEVVVVGSGFNPVCAGIELEIVKLSVLATDKHKN
jgi:hypothetical protein